MPRGTKTGSIIPVADTAELSGGFVVRKRYTDLKGRRREKKRFAFTITEANRVLRAVELEIGRELAGEDENDTRTFADLIAFYKDTELKPAEYAGETKIGGYRSFNKFESRIKPLQQFFGAMLLRGITYADVADFKRRRLNAPVIRVKQGQPTTATKTQKTKYELRPRALASVNRELALLRHLLFLALRERWITEHPFQRGKPLIQSADEVKRMRILTSAEETALLAECVGPRQHLRLEILFALETAVRQNEQFTLELRDVDLDDRVITVRAFNAKTAQTRLLPVTERLHRELGVSMDPQTRGLMVRLARLRKAPWPARKAKLVFPLGNPKRAFATACRLAGIEGLRWHDLRHTAITRLLHFYKLSPAEVMKISGHTNYKTFLRYVNVDREIARSLAGRIDALRPVATLPAEVAEATDSVN